MKKFLLISIMILCSFVGYSQESTIQLDSLTKRVEKLEHDIAFNYIKAEFTTIEHALKIEILEGIQYHRFSNVIRKAGVESYFQTRDLYYAYKYYYNFTAEEIGSCEASMRLIELLFKQYYDLCQLSNNGN